MKTLDPKKAPFFIGWSDKLALSHRRFLAGCILGLLLFFTGAAVLWSVRSQNLGDGQYGTEMTLRGTLELKPYAVLRLPADIQHGKAQTLMLSGEGKFGVEDIVAHKLNGRQVEARGVLLRRGTISMLQLDGGEALKLAESPQLSGQDQQSASLQSSLQSLGRWRLSGEICDGKCYAGAMKPGQGLAHKACANLCISGGVPPVFVSRGAVEGHQFMMIVGQDGKPMPAELFNAVGEPVTVEGDIERLDDLLVLKVDAGSVKR